MNRLLDRLRKGKVRVLEKRTEIMVNNDNLIIIIMMIVIIIMMTFAYNWCQVYFIVLRHNRLTPQSVINNHLIFFLN